jgi:hypothetical protein
VEPVFFFYDLRKEAKLAHKNVRGGKKCTLYFSKIK